MGFNTLPNQPSVYDGSNYVELQPGQTLDMSGGEATVKDIPEASVRKLGKSLITTTWGPELSRQRTEFVNNFKTPEDLTYSA